MITLLDDTVGATNLRIKQLPTTPLEFTNNFYNSQGNIIVQKSDIDNDYTASDTSSTSSGSKHKQYRARTRKENLKVRHGPKGNRVKWLDLAESPPAPPACPPSVNTDPARSVQSRIRGAPRAG